MDTATIDAPPVGARASVATPPKTSKEAGVTSFKDKFAEAAKAKAAAPTDAPQSDVSDATAELDQAKAAGLLREKPTPGEAKTDTKTEPTKKTTQADDIKALKAQRDEHEKNWKAAQAELDTVKKTYVAPDRLTAAEKRAAEMESKLEIQALADSPKFQRDYVEPKIALVDQARELVKDVGLEESVLDRAMTLTGKQRRDFLDESFAASSPSALAEIAGLLAQVDTLDRSKRKALDNWKIERDRMSEAERAAAMRDAQDERNTLLKAFDTRLQYIATKVPEFREIVGDLEHNQQVQADIAHARSIMDGTASQEDQADAPYLAVVARRALSRADAAEAELKKVSERLAQYEKAKPSVNGSDNSRESGNGKPMGMLARIGSRG